MEPARCPFCGDKRVNVVPGSTSRWCFAHCQECGATAPEVRRSIEYRDLICESDQVAALRAWNRRAPDPLREALLWRWAAGHHEHRLGRNCVEDNMDAGPGDYLCLQCEYIADMHTSATNEVERLLGRMER